MSIEEQALYRYIGQQIRAARKGVATQDKLAAKVGVTRTSIANIEAGTQKLPLHLLYRICEALDTEATAFLPTLSEVTKPTEGEVIEVEGQSIEVSPKTASFVRESLENLSQEEDHGP